MPHGIGEEINSENQGENTNTLQCATKGKTKKGEYNSPYYLIH